MTSRLRALAARLDRSMPAIAGRAGRKARRVVRSPRLRRLRRRPRWGNLRRPRPFSDNFGWDRGTPVDRVYLHDFFERNAAHIRGHVLEVQQAEFSESHGSDVTSCDVLDIDAYNDRATVVGDLAEIGSLPSGTYDCAVVPQTLQYVTDLGAAVDNLWESLAAGGVALITVPSISRLDPVHAEEDRWRMLPAGLHNFLEQRLPDAEVDVRGYGNLLSATAFLFGVAAEELSSREIEVVDPSYPILACARVRKPEGRLR